MHRVSYILIFGPVLDELRTGRAVEQHSESWFNLWSGNVHACRNSTEGRALMLSHIVRGVIKNMFS